MKNIKYLAFLWMLITVSLVSCDEDDSYQIPELQPVGGFVDQEMGINTGYMSTQKENLSCYFEMNRIGVTQTVNFQVGIESVEPEEYASAFVVTNPSVSVTGRDSVQLEILEVDWSKIPAGTNVQLALSIVEEEGMQVDLNSGRKSMIVAATKEATPVVTLNQSMVYAAVMESAATENQVFTLTMEVLDKPAEQSLEIPLRLNEYSVQAGVHFNMDDPVLRLPAGSTSCELEIEVIKGAFAIGETLNLWLEIHQDDIDENLLVAVGDNWWTTINLGRDFVYHVFMDKSVTHELLMDAQEIGNNTFRLQIPDLLNKVASEDVVLPIQLNQYYATEGTHFNMASKQIVVKAGSTTGELEIEIIGDAFQSGENVQLWVEIHQDDQSSEITVDDDNWWTTLLLGRR